MTPDQRAMARRLKASGYSDDDVNRELSKYSDEKPRMSRPDQSEYLFNSTGGMPEVSGGDSSRASRIASNISSGASTEDIASQGLIMSGNPYAMGAGLGLAVISADAKRKQRDREMKAQMQIDRIERQQRALSSLMSLSQGMGL